MSEENLTVIELEVIMFSESKYRCKQGMRMEDKEKVIRENIIWNLRFRCRVDLENSEMKQIRLIPSQTLTMGS